MENYISADGDDFDISNKPSQTYDSRNNSINYPFSGSIAPKDSIKLFTSSPTGTISDAILSKIENLSNMALIPITDEWLPSVRRLSGDSALWSLSSSNKDVLIRPSTGLIIRYFKSLSYFRKYVIKLISSASVLAKQFGEQFKIASDLSIHATNKGISKAFVIDSETGRFTDASGFSSLFKSLFPSSLHHLWNERDFYYQLSKYLAKWDAWALNNFSNSIYKLVALVVPLPDKGLYIYDNKLVTNTYKGLSGHEMAASGIVSFQNKLYFLAYLGDSIADGKKIEITVESDSSTKAADKDVSLKNGKLTMDDLNKMWNSDVVIVPNSKSGVRSSQINNTSDLSKDDAGQILDTQQVESIRRVNKFNSASTPILDWAAKMHDIKNGD